MSGFAVNVVLALAWALLTGGITLPRLGVGFLIGYALLVFTERLAGEQRYTLKAPRIVAFVFYFVRELTAANLRVALDVLTRAHRSHPGVIAVPLEARTDLEITLLANLISLTPGTLSLDVSPDRSVLYVHEMFVDDPDAIRHAIKVGLERRLLEILR